MAKILYFPHHRIPKTRGWARKSRLVRSLSTAKKYSAGMRSRIFQLDMAVTPSPTAEAVAVVPPMASMTSSTDVSMPSYNPCDVDLSRVHKILIEEPRNMGKTARMADDPKIVGARLWAVRMLLGDGETQEQFGKRVGTGKSTYQAWENGQNMLDIDAADRVALDFGLTLDWLYAGRGRGIEPQTLLELNQAAAARVPTKRRTA